jgi:two-component system phosphate regulon response regulator OmpR
VVGRSELAQLCGLKGNERAVDVHVTRLRRKIEPDSKIPIYLQTVRGKGYLLRTASDAPSRGQGEI